MPFLVGAGKFGAGTELDMPRKVEESSLFGNTLLSKKYLPLVILLGGTALLYVAAGLVSGQLNLADDYAYIVQIGHYDRAFNFAGLLQIFGGISKQEMIHDYYRPIYTLVRSIDYRLYGIVPGGYHVTSLLYYLVAVGAAYWILVELLPSSAIAFCGALLFAVHPIHVEPVAWIMAGGYAIAGAFALLSFALYLSKRTALSTVAFAAAALTNPPAVVLPALVGWHLWFFRDEQAKERKRRRVNLAWLSVVAAAVVYLNFVVFPQRYSRTFFDSAVAARSWLADVATYLRLMVVPVGLHTPYEGYVEKLGDPRWWAGAACLLLLGAGGFRLRKRRPLVAFGLIWFMAGILPTVTVWKNATSMADRYAFIASFGLILVAVSLVSEASFSGLFGNLRVARASAAVAVACLTIFGAVTWQRVRAWHDTETLFTDTLRKNPANIFRGAHARALLLRQYVITRQGRAHSRQVDRSYRGPTRQAYQSVPSSLRALQPGGTPQRARDRQSRIRSIRKSDSLARKCHCRDIE